MKKFKNYGFILLVMLFSKFLMGFGEATVYGDQNAKTTYNLGDLAVRAWSLRARVMNPGVVGDSIVVKHGEWLQSISRNDLFSGYATTTQLNDYMTTSVANSSFTAMQATVDTKVPASRTLTIGGSTFDLSANRTWNLTTSNVSEGTNLYFTDSRFDTRFNTKTTTNLIEGSNLYFTNTRFNTAFSGKSTTDLLEGTNQYFTQARARSSFSAGASIDITAGVITNTAPDPGRIVNTATVGLSKANLNSTYPNVPVGYMVMCPNILLGGAVYIKATEAGSADVWQTVSAPPTL